MTGKRDSQEWRRAIIKVIKNHAGEANYGHFYGEIPQIFQLTERELRPSTAGANFEAVWRGTLRGYLCDMVQEGALVKSGARRSPLFRINQSA